MSIGHAAMALRSYFDDLERLDRVDWAVMKSRFWNDTKDHPGRSRRRQAEFLVHRQFPWELVGGIAVSTCAVQIDVQRCLSVVRDRAIKSIAVPPLGCGNGGLKWDEVFLLIESAFAPLPDVRVLVYAPQPAPSPEAMPVASKRPNLTPSRACMVLLCDRYNGPGYRLARLEVQKLGYLLQEAGEPLNLKFVKGKYGPYADNLNHVFKNMEGHYTRGFGDLSDDSSIAPIPGAVEKAEAFIAGTPDVQRRLDRVASLIYGFEEPYGLELLATTHWVAREVPAARADWRAAVEAVHNWNERKRAVFQPEHIEIVWRHLKDQRWFDFDAAGQA